MFFPTKKHTQQIDPIVFNIIVGEAPLPTKEDYDVLRQSIESHKAIMKIIDYRIANSYKLLGKENPSNEELQSINGAIRALTTLKSIIK